MIEIDGPPRAYFQGNGERLEYTTYGYYSLDPKSCLDAYANWYNALKDDMIVWRRKPVLEEVPASSFEADQPPFWKMTWRCVIIEYFDPSKKARIKLEGKPLPIE